MRLVLVLNILSSLNKDIIIIIIIIIIMFLSKSTKIWRRENIPFYGIISLPIPEFRLHLYLSIWIYIYNVYRAFPVICMIENRRHLVSSCYRRYSTNSLYNAP